MGVSARQVHKACAAQGFSVVAWVRRERLDRISRDLTDASLRNRSVAAIAARWGILDSDHLGRQLKRLYGQSASEMRRHARETYLV
ncbi:helix-turn-helix domain-containing protein [Rhodococcus oxybenzonivorans]|uniref:helix-turn-helix domain-containing protein n=1 Tax=Rhodococcus oxybenzonivorans TaxID=1990687 RepID=UPI0013A541DB